jgi:signal transduction histidine kinase
VASQLALAITRARAFEAERCAREEAERVGNVQEQLMAIVGHDLRTPLAAVAMTATLLQKRGGLAAPQAEAVARIGRSAARMSAIISDLLDFSRARKGLGIPIQVSCVDVAEVARRVVAELEATDHRRSVQLSVEGDAVVRGDADRLAQATSNLVGNAIEHGEGPSVAVAVRGRDRHVELTVHNDGQPIAAHEVAHVFEPFRRGEHRESARANSHLGLGLFIVHAIVAAHGGDIEVRSDAATGTTFVVRWPRAGAA